MKYLDIHHNSLFSIIKGGDFIEIDFQKTLAIKMKIQ